ncbi:MAG TPA: triphosphoribosyl-dephospho-CoA synthase [Vicinamibacterales bacterium]
MTNIHAPATAGRALAADVASAAQLACLLEASAPKPGNVSPGRHFADARYEDFLASAVAIGGPLAGAGTRAVGETVRLAVEATARWTRSNTNLGIVLLLTPIARAALLEKGAVPLFPEHGEKKGYGPFSNLRDAIRDVLESTTVDDARDVYAAIRRAGPGGLGQVEAEDVANEPTLTLLDTMRLAADRDGIAHEYATAFEVTFGTGAPALERARGAGLSWDDAVVETFLTLLAEHPDTHIVRRGGAALAVEVSHQARSALASGGVGSAAGRRAIETMDRLLRDSRNTANPGTTADLTAAAIFVVLLGGGWSPSQTLRRPDEAFGGVGRP